MCTGKLEMMKALLMRDGWYDDAIANGAIFSSKCNWKSL
jgi:hypothetical protein